MSVEIIVDCDSLEYTSRQLLEATDYFNQAAQYAKDADPDWWMWGISGTPFAAIYFPASNGMQWLFSQVGPGLEGVVETIDENVAQYRQLEEDLEKIFDGMCDLIDAANAAFDALEGADT